MVDPDGGVQVTFGATEAIAAALLAFLAEGDEVIALDPSYDSYAPIARRAGAAVRPIALDPPGWRVEEAAIEAALSERTRVLVLNSPHNPTGRVLERYELELLADGLPRHDLIAVTDEVYEHLVYDGAHVPLATLPGMAERTLTCSSLGKTHSLTGLEGRLGHRAAGADRARAGDQAVPDLRGRHAVPARGRGGGGPATTRRAWPRELAAKRDRLAAGLRELGFDVLPTAGTYFLNADAAPLGHADARELCLRLPEEAGVAAIPVSAFSDAAGPRWARWCGSRSASAPRCWTRRSIVCNAGPVMADRATILRDLHEAPEILVLANVWDAASARAVAAVEGMRALATASHSIAAAHGYDDGEHIPLDLHLAAVERVTAATELPVSMDFESGYGDPGETTRRALAAGAVGANLEDRMRPLDEAVAAVEAVVAAREAEGAGFVLNARTDAFLVAAEPGRGDRGRGRQAGPGVPGRRRRVRVRPARERARAHRGAGVRAGTAQAQRDRHAGRAADGRPGAHGRGPRVDGAVELPGGADRAAGRRRRPAGGRRPARSRARGLAALTVPADAVLDDRALNRALLARQGLLERRQATPLEMVERLVGVQAERPLFPVRGAVVARGRLRPGGPGGGAHRSRRGAAVGHARHDPPGHRRRRRWPCTRSPGACTASRFARNFGKGLAGADPGDVAAAAVELMTAEPRTKRELADLLAERWPDADRESLGVCVTHHAPCVQVPPRGLFKQPGRRAAGAAGAVARPRAGARPVADRAGAALPGRVRAGHRGGHAHLVPHHRAARSVRGAAA